MDSQCPIFLCHISKNAHGPKADSDDTQLLFNMLQSNYMKRSINFHKVLVYFNNSLMDRSVRSAV